MSSSLLAHFQGKEGRFALLHALRRQVLIDGNSEIAERIARVVQVKEYAAGLPLFFQGERSSDMYFVLAGRVAVYVDRKEVATVGSGLHIWEIDLLERFKGRTATVISLQPIVVAQIAGRDFTDIARHHPELWRRMALGYVYLLDDATGPQSATESDTRHASTSPGIAANKTFSGDTPASGFHTTPRISPNSEKPPQLVANSYMVDANLREKEKRFSIWIAAWMIVIISILLAWIFRNP